MGTARTLKRKILRKKLKDMGLPNPSKKLHRYWKDYKSGRKI